MLKPLIREIFLFDSYIAGTSYLKDKSVFEELQEGCRLTMQRERNKFDDNEVFSRLLNAGKMLAACVKSSKKISDAFMKVGIGIYLVDI